MGGDEQKKLAQPVQSPTPSTTVSKRRIFRFLTPFVERLNGNGHTKPDLETPKGLSIAKHERKNLSAYLGSVDMALDGYDDIFSDFDPSPFSRRALSRDFLPELTQRYSEMHYGKIEVVLSLPRAARNRDTEALIKDRLKKYFEWQLHEIQKDLRKERWVGACYIGVGAAVIILTGNLAFYATEHTLKTLTILGEIFLVPGWFGVFEGLVKIFESREKMSKQMEFFAKFCDASYVFISAEDVLEKMAAAQGKRLAPIEKPADAAANQNPAPAPAAQPPG